MIAKNPESGWYEFTNALLKFQLRGCEDALATWISIKDNFYRKTSDKQLEGYKNALWAYLGWFITKRVDKFYYNQLDEVITIPPESTETAFLSFIKNELSDYLTSKQKSFLENEISGTGSSMSPAARCRMKKRIVLAAEKVFKLKYGNIQGERAMQKQREIRQIQDFLNGCPSVEDTLQFAINSLDENTKVEAVIYDQLPISYRKILFKGIMSGNDWLYQTSIVKEMASLILENLRNYVEDV
jgi:hypothetical protein